MSHKDAPFDYYLWDHVTKTCDRKSAVDYAPSQAEFAAMLQQSEAPLEKPLLPVSTLGHRAPLRSYTDRLLGQAKAAPQMLDARTYKKLSRAKLVIERRLDLHGAKQDQAHAMLLRFLHRASRDRLRYAIIITGKGSNGDGVLRQMVPKWLQWGEASRYVSAFAPAASKHGANGALYVRIKAHRLG